MYYYATALADAVMHDSASMPRYRHLARKGISHYIGDLYNPETFDHQTELDMRNFIGSIVSYKVMYKIPYDWPFIENWFKLALFEAGFTHLTYDMDLIERGYHEGRYDRYSIDGTPLTH